MGQSSRSVPAEERSGCPFLDSFDLDTLSTVPVTGHNLVGARFLSKQAAEHRHKAANHHEHAAEAVKAHIEHRLHKGLKYDVKNGVVTLTGEVNSQARRAQVKNVASAVPNVQQVVNELQVKNQKATSSHGDLAHSQLILSPAKDASARTGSTHPS
jgi:BON domain